MSVAATWLRRLHIIIVERGTVCIPGFAEATRTTSSSSSQLSPSFKCLHSKKTPSKARSLISYGAERDVSHPRLQSPLLVHLAAPRAIHTVSEYLLLLLLPWFTPTTVICQRIGPQTRQETKRRMGTTLAG